MGGLLFLLLFVVVSVASALALAFALVRFERTINDAYSVGTLVAVLVIEITYLLLILLPFMVWMQVALYEWRMTWIF